MTELRLPTVSVPIQLRLVGHEAVGAEIFVSDVPRSGRTELYDHVAALLEAAVGFVPVRMEGRVKLVPAHAMAWIAIEGEGDEPTAEFTLHDRRHQVEIELAGGMVFAGALLDSSPADHPRAIDHLNRAGAFIHLWTPEWHYLISKAQIVGVTES